MPIFEFQGVEDYGCASREIPLVTTGRWRFQELFDCQISLPSVRLP